MKSIENAKQQGYKIADARHGLDLAQENIVQLLDVYADNGGQDTSAAYVAITAAYYAGLAIGYRNAQPKSYYFTFGSNPAYPYGREDFIQILARDIHEAAAIFRKHYPNRPGSTSLNCADYYTEKQFSAIRPEYYAGKQPAEVLTA